MNNNAYNNVLLLLLFSAQLFLLSRILYLDYQKKLK